MEMERPADSGHEAADRGRERRRGRPGLGSLSAPGEPIPEEEREPEPDPGTNEPPPARFREPVVFDVFESDGRYLGQVRAPRGFSTYPRPIFRGDHVWAVVRDALDINYIIRFSIGETPETRELPES